MADLIGDIDTADGLASERLEALEFIRATGAVSLLRGYGLPEDYQRALLELVKSVGYDD